MKRIALAGVVALALTLACQQKASAWGWQWSGNIGISIGADFKCWDCCPPGAPCWAAPCYSYGGYDYAPPAYAPYYPYYAGAAAAQTAPAIQPQGPALAAQSSLQPIGYYYGGYGYSNYGSYQAPSYWYGR